MIAAHHSMIGGGKLPYLCELEYLESTGTQWIDTGIYGGDGTLGEVKVKRTSNVANECVLGAWNPSANRLWFAYSNTNKWYLGYGSSAGTSNISSQGDDFFVIKSEISNGKFGYTIDGQSYFLSTTYNTGFSCSNSILAFAMGTNTGANYLAKAQVAYIKIWNNGRLVRDYIPVLTYDYEACLYDRVTRQFFRNAGTGDFVAGPIVDGGGTMEVIEWIDGYRLLSGGGTEAASGKSYSDTHIPIVGGHTYTALCGAGGSVNRYCLVYNANNGMLQNVNESKSNETFTFTAHSNAAYIRLTINTTAKTAFYVHDDTADAYIVRNGVIL